MRSRGELTIAFLSTWKDAGIPATDTLKAMTVNGYACAQVERERGAIRPGHFADLIAVRGNPLEDIAGCLSDRIDSCAHTVQARATERDTERRARALAPLAGLNG